MNGAERIYARLLGLYPQGFRERFGQDMTELFCDLMREARREGRPAGVAALWARALLDVAAQAPAEHCRDLVRWVNRRLWPLPGDLAARRQEEEAMGRLGQDVRYGIRTLLRRPGFTVVALLTLALGIGATTALFSVVNAALLRPLPYQDANRLMWIYETNPKGERDGVSPPTLKDWQEQARSFTGLAGVTAQSVNLTGLAEPERLVGGFVSSGFFDLLGVKPASGRTFLPAEDEPGADRVAVISHGLWQRRYGSDPAMLGKTMVLNNESFTVAGVLAPSFWFPFDVDVWVPIQHYPNWKMERSARVMWAIARIRPEIDLEQARAEMSTLSERLAQAHPADMQGHGVDMRSLHTALVEDTRTALLVLLGAVGLILLIACANIANLLLAQGVGRQRELAVRAALGASRRRLVTQLLTETALLAVFAGALGLLLARWGVAALEMYLPTRLPVVGSIELDAQVLGFALLLSAGTCLLFGLVPALHLSKADLHESLKEGGRNSGGARRSRLRGAFVVAEVALALVLLIGAGLLMRSFRELMRQEPGFNPHNLLTMEYRLPRNKYPTGEQQWDFHRQVVERIAAVPGVDSASLIRGLPFSGNGGATKFTLPDRQPEPEGKEPEALFNAITPEYLETVKLPLLSGRGFTVQDGAQSAPVVLINALLAQKYWPAADPIGKTLVYTDWIAPDKPVTATIVGVVGNARQYELREELRPQFYIPYSQAPFIFATVAAHTSVEPMSISRAVQEAIWSVDRDQPMWKIRTMQFLLDRDLAYDRFVLGLMGLFALLALTLTMIGIYGVVSYTVSQRTQEIGIRIALGAGRGAVLRLVLGQGLRLTAVGLGLGLAGAFALSRVMQSLLYGVSPTDLPTFAGLALLLGSVAALASYLPARRAARIDPLVALRWE